MSAEQNKKSKKKEHILSGDLTLQVAGEVKESFVRALSGKGDVTFRFDDIGDVDLSFIQILCSAHRFAHDEGKKINFSGEWPEPFTTLIEESGLNVHVGCSLGGGIECPWNIEANLNK